MRIKDMSARDMPRERLARYGTEKLAPHELLAVVLGSGVKGNSVLKIAKQIERLIHKRGIEHVTEDDLKKIRGLGSTKILQIRALLALITRLEGKGAIEILSPIDVFNLCIDIRASKREHFLAFYFNTQHQLLERQVISIGTLNSSLVHPREVFEPALRLNAASVIIAHNHPSGSLVPSPQDHDVTLRLVEAGELLGIPVLDHVLVTARTYKSLFEELVKK